MQIYPAIDIQGGRVVRAVEGERRRDREYASDPVAQAEAFVALGASWLHVVDMDRAFRTGGDNTVWVRRIAALDGVHVQLGGNVNSLAWALAALDAGVSRVILGTAAALDPPALARLVDHVGAARCGFAVDVRDGRVFVRGQDGVIRESVNQLVMRALGCGVGTIVYRDVVRDGTVAGADIAGAARLVPLGAGVIVAGGVAGLDDVRSAQQAGLTGVIVGRALYEERFTLPEAVRCLE